MGVAGRFFAQLFGTTLCDFGAIMRWWRPVCSGSSSASGYLLPLLSRGFPSGLSVCALPSCLHPSPTPPRPPFQGGAGGGELGGGDLGGIRHSLWRIRFAVIGMLFGRMPKAEVVNNQLSLRLGHFFICMNVQPFLPQQDGAAVKCRALMHLSKYKRLSDFPQALKYDVRL